MPNHASTCHLQISFCAHNDFNIQKFQSHCSRYVPLAKFYVARNGYVVVFVVPQIFESYDHYKIGRMLENGEQKGSKSMLSQLRS